MILKRFLPLLLVLFASLVITVRVSAQKAAPTSSPGNASATNSPTDNDVNRVAKKLYCPVCPNTPLDVCTTQACKDWRAQIRDQLSSGWTEQEVMAYFARQYGERVLAEPERGGFTSLVWLLPVLVVLLGLIAVWLILKSWKASRRVFPATIQPVAPAPTSVPRDILAKIEAEIRRMD